MPVLHRAVSELLYRYPDVRSGIGIADEMLLRYISEVGPMTLRVIGHTMAYNESPDWQGDDYLFHRLLRMAEQKFPLVTLTARKMRGSEVRLIALGESVLAGKANNVRENGIDDWIGGVHLTDNKPVPLRDGSSLQL